MNLNCEEKDKFHNQHSYALRISGAAEGTHRGGAARNQSWGTEEGASGKAEVARSSQETWCHEHHNVDKALSRWSPVWRAETCARKPLIYLISPLIRNFFCCLLSSLIFTSSSILFYPSR